MILYVLFAQRKCRYEGEYAPETLEICDEFTMDENPEWMENKIRDVKESGLYSGVELVEIVLLKDAAKRITDRLRNTLSVKADVLSNKE